MRSQFTQFVDGMLYGYLCYISLCNYSASGMIGAGFAIGILLLVALLAVLFLLR